MYHMLREDILLPANNGNEVEKKFSVGVVLASWGSNLVKILYGHFAINYYSLIKK